ncbi:immunoglobulin-like domain-containing protein, partial [Pseudomonas sp. 148P]
PVNASNGSVDFIAPNNVLNTNTPLTNSITGVTGGNYEHLETAGTPTTVVTDDPARLDTTGLTLSASGTVQEGGEITYTARLTNPAGTEMKISLPSLRCLAGAARPTICCANLHLASSAIAEGCCAPAPSRHLRSAS